MKKTTYTFIAIILICLAAVGFLVYERIGDHRQLQLLNIQVEELSKNLQELQLEKKAWEGEKTRVVQSLDSVQGVLRTTLGELDIVVESIEKSLDASNVVRESPTPIPQATLEPTPEGKSAPSASPRVTASPAATKQPAVTGTPKPMSATPSAQPAEAPATSTVSVTPASSKPSQKP